MMKMLPAQAPGLSRAPTDSLGLSPLPRSDLAREAAKELMALQA